MSDNNNSDGGGGHQISAFHDLVAGGVAGSASVIVGHPFDTIKVRLQTSSATNPNSPSTAGGFKSLFKGMSPPLATAAMCNAIIFASYGYSTRLWEEMLENKSQKHDDEIHGLITEGAVMIEHGDHGTHEQMKKLKQTKYDTLEEGTINGKQHYENTSSQSLSSSEDGSNTTSSTQQNYLKVFACGSVAGTVQAFVICVSSSKY